MGTVLDQYSDLTEEETGDVAMQVEYSAVVEWTILYLFDVMLVHLACRSRQVIGRTHACISPLFLVRLCPHLTSGSHASTKSHTADDLGLYGI